MAEKRHDTLPAIPPSLFPSTFTEALEFCKMLADSTFVPQNYKGKAGDILAAIQYGAEVGLAPMQALQGIAVINGRPSIWGDAMVGLVQRSGLLVHHKEYFDGTTAVCEVQRKGDKEVHIVKFGDAEARKAGLSNKAGPWTQYPDRMKMWRARGFAFRDKFADVLKGLISREEAVDMSPPTEEQESWHSPHDGELKDNEIPRARVEGGREEGEADGQRDVGEAGAEADSSHVAAADDAITEEQRAEARALWGSSKTGIVKRLHAVREKMPEFNTLDDLQTQDHFKAFCDALVGA